MSPWRTLGRSGITVTSLCIGTSPLGWLEGTDGTRDAELIIERALTGPIRFLDTANEYGAGASERHIGSVLRRLGGVPDGYVIATKADAATRGGDFSAARVRASFDESRARLGMDRFEVYYLHDPERYPYEQITGPGGALDGMLQLKADGLITALGIGAGNLEQLHRYLDTGHFDVVLNHNRYTLLDRSAEPLIEQAMSLGMGFVNAAPYASGILAKPRESGTTYQYRTPSAEVTAKVGALHALCSRYGIPLAAAALQFSTRDPRIASTVVGMTHPDRVDELIANDEVAVPEDFWPNADDIALG